VWCINSICRSWLGDKS